jgi:hypothetical protein
MYDFLKIRNDADEINILRNELLKFGFNQDINEPTEEITYPIKTKESYKTFDFKITENSIFSQGTFHKYWQNGTNWGDFDLKQFEQAVNQYCKEFQVNPSKSQLHKVEFGVNITTPFVATLKNIRKVFVSYKGTPFESLKSYSGRTIGVECNLSQYRIKIYSKTLQYKLKENVLRFEIQVKKMQKLSFEKVYLSDLLKLSFTEHCKNELINVLQQIIIYDDSLKGISKKDKEFLKDVSNPNYWAGLNSSNYYKKKSKYDDLVKNHSLNNMKIELINLVKEKGDVLTNFEPSKKATYLPLV